MSFWDGEVWLENIPARDGNDVTGPRSAPNNFMKISGNIAARFIDLLTSTAGFNLLDPPPFMAYRRFRSESLCLQAAPPAGYYLLLALNSVSGALYSPWFPHSSERRSINDRKNSPLALRFTPSAMQLKNYACSDAIWTPTHSARNFAFRSYLPEEKLFTSINTPVQLQLQSRTLRPIHLNSEARPPGVKSKYSRQRSLYAKICGAYFIRHKCQRRPLQRKIGASSPKQRARLKFRSSVLCCVSNLITERKSVRNWSRSRNITALWQIRGTLMPPEIIIQYPGRLGRKTEHQSLILAIPRLTFCGWSIQQRTINFRFVGNF